MNNWKDIIDKYQTERGIHRMFIDLHNNGFLKKDITEEILTHIINKFSKIHANKFNKDRLDKYLLHIIECCIEYHIKEKPTPKKNLINKSSQKIEDLKPEDFKDKECDVSFIKNIGWEMPDE